MLTAGVVLASCALVAGAPASYAATGSIRDLSVKVANDGGDPANPADDNTSNGKVGLNDYVEYAWTFATTGTDDLLLSQTLPEGWKWDENRLDLVNTDLEQYSSTATVSEDGRTLSATVDVPVGSDSTITLDKIYAQPTRPAVGQSYAAELAATDETGVQTADATSVDVVKVDVPELAVPTKNSVTSKTYDFGSGAEPATSIDTGFDIVDVLSDEVLTDVRVAGSGNERASEPAGIDAVTSMAGPIEVKMNLAFLKPEFGWTSPDRVAALVTSTSPSGATVEVKDVTVGASGAIVTLLVENWSGNVQSDPLHADVSLLMPDADLVPGSKASASFRSSVSYAPAEGQRLEEVFSNNNSAGEPVFGPRTDQYGVLKTIYVPKDGTDADSSSPVRANAEWTANPVAGEGGVKTASPGSRIWASVNANDLGKGEDAAFTLYDYWNPDEQQIADAAVEFRSDAENWSIEYSSDADREGDPENATWHSSVAAAGGPAKVNAVRGKFAGTADSTGAEAMFVPFDVVSDVDGAEVFDYGEVRASGQQERESKARVVVDDDHQVRTELTTAESVIGSNSFPVSVKAVAGAQPGLNESQAEREINDLVITTAFEADSGVVGVDDSRLDPFWEMTISGNAKDGFTAEFRPTVPVYADESDEWPMIEVDAQTSLLVKDGEQVLVTSRADAANAAPSDSILDTRKEKANVTTVAPKLAGIQKILTSDALVSGPGAHDITWDVEMINTLAQTQGETNFLDVLPYEGDPHGSDFAGELDLTGISASGDAADLQFEYTTDAPAAVEAAPDAADWKPLPADVASVGEDVTALRAATEDFGAGFAGTVTISAEADGLDAGDELVNGISAETTSETELTSEALPVAVADSAIRGVAWIDDGDGIRQSGEAIASGIDVTLKSADGSETATTKTNAKGQYAFSGLYGGDYTVTFDVNGETAPQKAGSNRALDSDVDAKGVAAVSVTPGDELRHIDAGIVKSIAVADVADQENTVGDEVEVPVKASSNDGSELEFSAEGLPEGVSIDAATGVISGSPTTKGDYAVTVSVSSNTIKPVETTFNWKVNPVPAIAVADVADQENTVGDEVEVPVKASSNDGSELEFSAEGLPEGVSIDAATGVISGSPTTKGDYAVTVSVSSNTIKPVETTFNWVVNEVPKVPGDDTDGDNTDGGDTDGGNTDGGNTDGGNTDGGNIDGGSSHGDDTGADGGSDGASVHTGGELANTGGGIFALLGALAAAIAAGFAGVMAFLRRRRAE